MDSYNFKEKEKHYSSMNKEQLQFALDDAKKARDEATKIGKAGGKNKENYYSDDVSTILKVMHNKKIEPKESLDIRFQNVIMEAQQARLLEGIESKQSAIVEICRCYTTQGFRSSVEEITGVDLKHYFPNMNFCNFPITTIKEVGMTSIGELQEIKPLKPEENVSGALVLFISKYPIKDKFIEGYPKQYMPKKTCILASKQTPVADEPPKARRSDNEQTLASDKQDALLIFIPAGNGFGGWFYMTFDGKKIYQGQHD